MIRDPKPDRLILDRELMPWWRVALIICAFPFIVGATAVSMLLQNYHERRRAR